MEGLPGSDGGQPRRDDRYHRRAVGAQPAMAASPVGIVALAIAGLVAAFAALYASNSGFRDWVQGVWQGIKDFMAPIIDWFRRTIPPLWEKISDAVSTAMGIVSDVIKRVWGFIGPFVTGYLQTMWNVYSTVFKAVWSVVSETMETIWSVIRTVWNFIYPFVSRYLQTMWNVCSTIFKARVVGGVYRHGCDLVGDQGSSGGDRAVRHRVLKEMWANVVNIFDGIKAAISLAMNVVRRSSPTSGTASSGCGTTSCPGVGHHRAHLRLGARQDLPPRWTR